MTERTLLQSLYDSIDSEVREATQKLDKAMQFRAEVERVSELIPNLVANESKYGWGFGRLWWEAGQVIYIPWNDEILMYTWAKLTELGWMCVSEDDQVSEMGFMRYDFAHPDTTIKLRIHMSIEKNENFMPDEQKCRLVQVSTKVETREVPVYEVKCNGEQGNARELSTED